MNAFKNKVLSLSPVIGTWCNLETSISSEIIALCGFDWILLDAEHRPSSTGSLLQQLQSISAFEISPVIRVPWLDRVHVKWALDIGASGIMFPSIDTAAQAKEAVSFMRYAPDGVRGVTGGSRASGYGFFFKDYFRNSNASLLSIIQIETQAGLDNLEEIIKVDGVDVIFAGPVDLSISLGKTERFADPEFMNILAKIATMARAFGKPCGILLPSAQMAQQFVKMGYSFLAFSSDTAAMIEGLKNINHTAKEAIAGPVA